MELLAQEFKEAASKAELPQAKKMIAEKEERRNPLKASIAQDLRVAGDESKKDTKKDVRTKKKLKQAGKESQGNGKPPALDAERIAKSVGIPGGD